MSLHKVGVHHVDPPILEFQGLLNTSKSEDGVKTNMTVNGPVSRANTDHDSYFKFSFPVCQWPKSDDPGEVTITGQSV